MSKIVFFILATLTSCILSAKSWWDILQDKYSLISDPSLKIIIEQHQRFVSNTTPSIANPVIKNIEIIENNQPLVDIFSVNSNRISMLPTPLKNKAFYSPDCNSGLPSASKIRKEVYLKLEKMVVYLD